MPQDTQTGDERQAVLDARDRTFAAMFRPGEMVWLVQEMYNPVDDNWQVDFLRQGAQGSWMLQRYRYDGPSGVIYYCGESPVADGELAMLRRKGKRCVVR